MHTKNMRVLFQELWGICQLCVITFNEPIVPVEFGYFYDAHFPHKVDAVAVKVVTTPS